VDEKELEAFARETAQGLKTEKDLNKFSQMLTKITVEAAIKPVTVRSSLNYYKSLQRIDKFLDQSLYYIFATRRLV